jgi:hypothetical protein
MAAGKDRQAVITQPRWWKAIKRRLKMAHKGGFPWRGHRCIYCRKLAVTHPNGEALCAIHAADPDSGVYVLKLEQIKENYLKTYGVESWDEFCIRTFQANGKRYEDFTWKEISAAAQDELFRREHAIDTAYEDEWRSQMIDERPGGI